MQAIPGPDPAAGEAQADRPLQKMFTEVPPSYDLLNRLLTLRLDERWRARAAAACLEQAPGRVLDLCCGTGDLALRLRGLAPPATAIVGLDYSRPMLERAEAKARRRRLEGLDFRHGDVAALPFPDAHFQAIGIAFAFRNLTFANPDRDLFLREILRVLAPGGRFVIVETSQPRNGLLRLLVHAYLRGISAPVGGAISGHRGAYRYLSHSATRYWNAAELSAFLREAGFARVEARLLLGGVAALHTATR
jgi:demethylmenaquinone methyltransferase / 2-methoxy-6-polyprenyl-1,4-benzoquinol methylase